MKRLLNLRTLIGVSLICFAAWNPKLPIPSPLPDIDISTIVVEKPNQEVLDLVNPISVTIDNKEDRLKLAVFNYTFASRVSKYDTDTQKLNDIYVTAATEFFGDSLVDKYDDLDGMIILLFEKTTGSENHTLTQNEKENLASHFNGLTWALIQKR